MGLEFREGLGSSALQGVSSHSATFSKWLADLQGTSLMSGTLVPLHMASLHSCANLGFPTAQSQVIRLHTLWLLSQREKAEPAREQVPECHLCHILLVRECCTGEEGNGLHLLRGRIGSVHREEGMDWWPSLDTDLILFSQLLTLILTFLDSVLTSQFGVCCSGP